MRVLQHLFAKVKKRYFVGAPKVMEERLREDFLDLFKQTSSNTTHNQISYMTMRKLAPIH